MLYPLSYGSTPGYCSMGQSGVASAAMGLPNPHDLKEHMLRTAKQLTRDCEFPINVLES